MAGLWKLITLARSPAGRRLLSEAQKAARDPSTRKRIADVRARFERSGPRDAPPAKSPSAGPAAPAPESPER